MRLQIKDTGYFDTSHEYKVALLRAGDVFDSLTEQLPAPCRGKVGRGLWRGGLERPVFVEFEAADQI